MTINVVVNTVTDSVTITMSGTNNAYFAYGFGGTQMTNRYTFVDNGTGALVERKLATHAAGTILTNSISNLSSSTAGSVRTTTFKRARVGISADHYTFPSTAGNISIIWARGTGTTFVQHSVRGSTVLTLTNACNIPVTPTPAATICQGDSALIFGSYQSTPGTYYDTLSSVIGCDSVLSKQLTVKGGTYAQPGITLCQGTSTTLFGQVVSQAGTYTDTLSTTVGGCDSILTVAVTVTPVDTAVVFDPMDPYTLLSNAANATFEWLDCTTGQVVPNETSNQFIAQTPGMYAAIVTQNGCTDTSGCYMLQAWSTDDFYGQRLEVYPNPAKDAISLPGLTSGTFKVVDLSGRLVQAGHFEGGRIATDALQPGSYLLLIAAEEGTFNARLLKH